MDECINLIDSDNEETIYETKTANKINKQNISSPKPINVNIKSSIANNVILNVPVNNDINLSIHNKKYTNKLDKKSNFRHIKPVKIDKQLVTAHDHANYINTSETTSTTLYQTVNTTFCRNDHKIVASSKSSKNLEQSDFPKNLNKCQQGVSSSYFDDSFGEGVERLNISKVDGEMNESNKILDLTDRAEIKKSSIIAQYEELLKQINNRIRKLEEEDQGLDDMMTNSSAYILLDKYKRKYVEVWNKLCQNSSTTCLSTKLFQQKITLNGNHARIRAKVARFVNKTNEFPDYFDVQSIVDKCNSRFKLNKSKGDLDSIGRDIFMEVGNKLQRLRKANFKQLFGCHLTDCIRLGEDPALHDKLLQQKLTQNHKLSKNRIDDVINHFASRSTNRSKSGESDDSSDGENRGEDKFVANGDHRGRERLKLLNNPNIQSKSTNVANERSRVEDDDECAVVKGTKTSDEKEDTKATLNDESESESGQRSQSDDTADNKCVDNNYHSTKMMQANPASKKCKKSKILRRNDVPRLNTIITNASDDVVLNDSMDLGGKITTINLVDDVSKVRPIDVEEKRDLEADGDLVLALKETSATNNSVSKNLHLTNELILPKKDLRIILPRYDLAVPKKDARVDSHLPNKDLVLSRTLINQINKSIKLSRLLEFDSQQQQQRVSESIQTKISTKTKKLKIGIKDGDTELSKFATISNGCNLNDLSGGEEEEFVITDLRTLSTDLHLIDATNQHLHSNDATNQHLFSIDLTNQHPVGKATHELQNAGCFDEVDETGDAAVAGLVANGEESEVGVVMRVQQDDVDVYAVAATADDDCIVVDDASGDAAVSIYMDTFKMPKYEDAKKENDSLILNNDSVENIAALMFISSDPVGRDHLCFNSSRRLELHNDDCKNQPTDPVSKKRKHICQENNAQPKKKKVPTATLR